MKDSKVRRRSMFEITIEIIGWLQIFASPFLIAVIIGAVVYSTKSDVLGLSLAILIVVAGIVIGAIWATKVWKKRGTMQFMSKIMATPELDPPEDDSK